jgi:hypothetical protein
VLARVGEWGEMRVPLGGKGSQGKVGSRKEEEEEVKDKDIV